jgi:hypothetical protein
VAHYNSKGEAIKNYFLQIKFNEISKKPEIKFTSKYINQTNGSKKHKLYDPYAIFTWLIKPKDYLDFYKVLHEIPEKERRLIKPELFSLHACLPKELNKLTPYLMDSYRNYKNSFALLYLRHINDLRAIEYLKKLNLQFLPHECPEG